MPVREHRISHVNGPQVMVRGLRLADELGYQRGARVRVTDPNNPSLSAWVFTVDNDEHATLVSRQSRQPSWIRAGVIVRIEVTPPAGAVIGTQPPKAPKTPKPALPRKPAAADSASAAPLPPPPISRALTARTLFDTYLFVDWGAKDGRYGPGDKSDSPWLAEGWWDGLQLHWEPEQWFPTRRALIAHARLRLAHHVALGRRVLAGFDFAYGYPVGFGQALRLQDDSWSGVWSEIAAPTALPGGAPAPTNDYATANNENNRFALAAHLNERVGRVGGGPLYGCPQAHAGRWLQQQGPKFPLVVGNGLSLEKLRTTEQRLVAAGKSPLPTWWVLGGQAPTVGGQILTGIPAVRELRRDAALAPHSHVWPFETGFTATPTSPDQPAVIHAEIWPGTQSARVAQFQKADPSLVRDQAQVRAMVAWAAADDTAGTLGRVFDVPKDLSPSERRLCEREEGWILGA